MADAKVCDKCTNLIPGKVYGGWDEQREFLTALEANGLGETFVSIRVAFHRDDQRTLDLCGGCFRELVMKAARDPEPATVNHACHICGKPVEMASMTICVACADAH